MKENNIKMNPGWLIMAIVIFFAGVTAKSETHGAMLGVITIILLCTGRIIFEIQNQKKEK